VRRRRVQPDGDERVAPIAQCPMSSGLPCCKGPRREGPSAINPVSRGFCVLTPKIPFVFLTNFCSF
jgi:hypothetical protein